MKKLFKGAVPTIALLLVAVMSLTSLTYAWFTAGDTATVDTVDVSVKDVEGLLISPNGINGTWGSTMTPLFHLDANGSTEISGKTPNLTLRDVSTVGALSNGKMQFFSAEYDNKYDALISSTALTDILYQDPNNTDQYYANWIAFDVYLKNESASEFTINLDGSAIDATAMTRAVARVAVVNQGTASSKTVLADNTKPTITGTPGLVKIWEPNYSIHTANGQTWINNTGVSANGSGAIPYYGVAKEFSKVEGKYYNRAENGTSYSIVNTLETALDVANFTSGNYATTYYVYTETGDHFRAIKIDDFYKIADQQAVAAAVSATGTAGTATAYYKRTAEDTYVNLTIGDTLTQGESYYEKIAGIGTATGTVMVYTMAANDGNLADVSGSLVYAPSGIEVTLSAETITKLTVYIWFEGQDCDCNNDVAKNNFQLNLQFKKKPTT